MLEIVIWIAVFGMLSALFYMASADWRKKRVEASVLQDLYSQYVSESGMDIGRIFESEFLSKTEEVEFSALIDNINSYEKALFDFVSDDVKLKKSEIGPGILTRSYKQNILHRIGERVVKITPTESYHRRNLIVLFDSFKVQADYRFVIMIEDKLMKKGFNNNNPFVMSFNKGGAVIPHTETVFLSENAGLIESKSRRVYSGSSSGASFRIAKGVTIRTGGNRGTSESVIEEIIGDTGRMLITDKRIIFTGDSSTVDMTSRRIKGYGADGDTLSFHLSNRKRPIKIVVGPGRIDLVDTGIKWFLRTCT